MKSPRMTLRRRQVTALFAAGAIGLSLAACGGDTGGDGGNGDGGNGDGGDGDGGEGGGETISLGYIPSWTDGLSTAYLLDHFLTEAGYEVEHEELSEAGILYTALAEGDVDIYPSAWPEVTHANYMDEVGENVEDLATYYDNAKLTFAVPEYSDITSIDELPDHVDELGGRVVGIEPSAGLTEQTQSEVFPTYGLEEAGFSLATSSTTAMLAELEGAINAEEPIVVTLWRPFWANAAYPVRDLEDPEGALGEAEGLHFLANSEFSGEQPEVAEWIGQIHLDDEQYGALESAVVNDNPDDPAAGIEQFLEEYPDAIPELSAAE